VGQGQPSGVMACRATTPEGTVGLHKNIKNGWSSIVARDMAIQKINIIWKARIFMCYLKNPNKSKKYGSKKAEAV
jgi:hypothetical protein